MPRGPSRQQWGIRRDCTQVGSHTLDLFGTAWVGMTETPQASGFFNDLELRPGGRVQAGGHAVAPSCRDRLCTAAALPECHLGGVPLASAKCTVRVASGGCHSLSHGAASTGLYTLSLAAARPQI